MTLKFIHQCCEVNVMQGVYAAGMCSPCLKRRHRGKRRKSKADPIPSHCFSALSLSQLCIAEPTHFAFSTVVPCVFYRSTPTLVSSCSSGSLVQTHTFLCRAGFASVSSAFEESNQAFAKYSEGFFFLLFCLIIYGRSTVDCSSALYTRWPQWYVLQF